MVEAEDTRIPTRILQGPTIRRKPYVGGKLAASAFQPSMRLMTTPRCAVTCRMLKGRDSMKQGPPKRTRRLTNCRGCDA